MSYEAITVYSRMTYTNGLSYTFPYASVTCASRYPDPREHPSVRAPQAGPQAPKPLSCGILHSAMCRPADPDRRNRAAGVRFGMLARRFWPAIILCAFALLSALPPALAVPPENFLLETPRIRVQDNMLVLDLSVSVDSEDGLRDLLKDGASLALNVTVTIERNSSWWKNAEISSTSYLSHLRHDPLTRDFLVTIPGTEQQLRDRSLIRLLHSSWRAFSLTVIPVRFLEVHGQDSAFSVTCSFSLRHTHVPPWLESNSVFWSSDIVKPEQRTVMLRLPAINGTDDQESLNMPSQ